MDFLKAVNIIGRDLEEAMTLLEQLGVSGPEKAEIELARSRVRSAADLVRLLPSLNASNEKNVRETPQLAEVTPKKEINTNPPVEIKAPVAEPVRTEPVLAETVKTEPVKTEPVLTETVKTEAVKAEAVKAESVVGEQKSQEPSKAILADRFTAGGTLGEKISTAKKEEAGSSLIQGKPITDIAAAIGINDRFYFIRELFSGDALAYGDTINRLNAAASLGEAMKILDESTVMGSDPSAQSSFVDVVRRKFSLHV